MLVCFYLIVSSLLVNFDEVYLIIGVVCYEVYGCECKGVCLVFCLECL